MSVLTSMYPAVHKVYPQGEILRVDGFGPWYVNPDVKVPLHYLLQSGKALNFQYVSLRIKTREGCVIAPFALNQLV